jgi:hypothetical protein
MKIFPQKIQSGSCNCVVELVALRRVAPRFSGATNLQTDGTRTAPGCPLRGQTLSQRDNVHQFLTA